MRLRRAFVLAFQSIVFWMIAFFLYVFIKYNGLEEELKVYTDDTLYLPVVDFFQYGLILGLVIGVLNSCLILI